MTIDAILEDLNTLERKKQDLIKAIYPKFGDIFKPFFADFPEVKAIRFNAYTPYFNDGDECIYCVSDLQPELENEDGDDTDELFSGYSDHYRELLNLATTGTTGTTKSWHPKTYESWDDYMRTRYADELNRGASWLQRMVELVEAGEALNAQFGNIPTDAIKGLFGDHVKVTIHPHGDVTTDYYEHD